jgi:CO/xanthine dehydrogenase FAD-binding subunit
MDINTVTEVARPTSRDALPIWRAGDAWLSGGTWLFSDHQPDVRRLIDLESLGWPPVEVTDDGMTIAATCRIVDLLNFRPPADWTAAPLFEQCAHALLMSFKIYNMATVGGNICMSLPAGAMISLATALRGVCRIWTPDGGERRVPVEEFVTGVHTNVLQAGEVPRAVDIPEAALHARTAFRQISLASLGRSAALLIGTVTPPLDSFALTITAGVVRPLRLEFPALPGEGELRARITGDVTDDLYYDDPNGSPDYRRHITYLFAEQIRRELAEGGA